MGQQSLKRGPAFLLAGGVLALIGALAVGVLLHAVWIAPWNESDAIINGSDRPQAVDLHSHDPRLISVPANGNVATPDCHVEESGNRVVVPTSPDRQLGLLDASDGTWVGVLEFDPASTALTISCDANGGPVMIGPVPPFAEEGMAIFATASIVGLFVCFALGVMYSASVWRRRVRQLAVATA